MTPTVAEFLARWEAAGGVGWYVGPDERLGDRLAEAWQRWVPSDEDAVAALWLPEELDRPERLLPWIAAVRAVRWEPGQDPTAYRQAAAAAAMGVTGALAAVAETGSVLLALGPTTPLLPSLLPPIHVAVIPTDRVVATLSEAFHRLYRAAAAAGWPPVAKFVTGPSMTADIEGQLVVGVHGPRVAVAIVCEEPLA
ncbi:MAG: lactate utilization protein [Firmicutes bacterium]|nr:LUD domain-containing protein [Alicyclobacillaceae bacterium]MCL6497934.1 lactate utilization protein [Bacillota bacterium]